MRTLVQDAVIDCLSTMWIFYICMLFVGLLAILCIGRTELCKRYEEHKAGLGRRKPIKLPTKRKTGVESAKDWLLSQLAKKI